MCNLYSITTNQAAIAALFRRMNRYVGNLQPIPGVFGVSNDGNLLASLRRPKDVFGFDRAAIRERNRPSFRQLLAHWTVGHP